MGERAAWYWDKRGVRGERKESELGLASSLLAELDLTGKVVAGDAQYAQRELSLRVLEQGGDYFWALKDNQPGVKEAVSLLFEQPPWGERFAEACQEGRHEDGWEHRRIWASAALNEYLDWPGLGQVCCLERTRRHKDQEAQGPGNGGAGLRHHQPACGAGGCRPVAGNMAGALGDRKRAALGEGRGLWRGPKPGANGVSAATAGGAGELGDRQVADERESKT